MCKNRLMYLASLAGVLIFHTYYTGWFSWYLLMLTVTLPWFSLLCSLSPMLRLRIAADMPASCLMGQSAHIRLENAGARRLSPPYRLQSVVYDCMGMSVSRQKISLSGSKTAQLELATHHAGAYRCMLEKGSVYDYLGLFRFPLRLPELGELLVLPEDIQPIDTPSLTQLTARRYRAKPAGGFSETHEMRAYHPGDSMRDIHWKLSAKTDSLIVREPIEPVRGQAVLSFDLAGTRDAVDRTLGLLQWMSGWLLSQELSHTVCWLDPESFEPQTAQIASAEDLRTLLEQLLHTGLRDGTPSIANRSFPAADWRYHIGQTQAEVAV